jgi:hypothetical protein
MQRFIIASAADFETIPSVKLLTGNSLDFTRIVTGIGVTESAIIASRTRDLVAGRDIIFCCSGGVIGQFDTVGLFSASQVGIGSWDVRNHKAELLTMFDPILRLKPLSLTLPLCDVFCSFGISTKPEEQPPSSGPSMPLIQIETMELYSVARAWLPIVRSFTGIIATTNATGHDARADWKHNFEKAAIMTGEFLSNKLPQLALGRR